MSEQLAVTTVSPTHTQTDEFKLAFRLLREALPEDVKWVTASKGANLGQLVSDNLDSQTHYVLVMSEASFVPNAQGYREMRRLLDERTELQCVLPSDMRGHRPGTEAYYFTRRGFESFAEALYDPAATFAPYDGREPWMVLIRAQALVGRALPKDLHGFVRLFRPEQAGIALNAFVHSFAGAYEFNREDVLPFVPPGIRSLLDIGCAQGHFGALVKEKLGCRVVGAELNSYEAQFARQQLDEVFVGNVLTLATSERFDCVTCLDVLEHFAEPAVLLEKIRGLLEDNGRLVLSVPNVGHWSIVEDLLAGRWDYVPAGILCNTHLRFFAEQSLRDLLESNGYNIVVIAGLSTKIPERLLHGLKALAESGLKVDEGSLARTTFYVVAEPT